MGEAYCCDGKHQVHPLILLYFYQGLHVLLVFKTEIMLEGPILRTHQPVPLHQALAFEEVVNFTVVVDHSMGVALQDSQHFQPSSYNEVIDVSVYGIDAKGVDSIHRLLEGHFVFESIQAIDILYSRQLLQN